MILIVSNFRKNMRFAINEKVEKNQNLMLIVTTLNFTKTKRKNKTLIIIVIIQTIVESRIIICLIDFETKINFISQSLIKNVQLKKNIVIDELIKIVDEHMIRIYDTFYVDMFIDDSQKKFENFECEFYVVNMNDYDMILKYS